MLQYFDDVAEQFGELPLWFMRFHGSTDVRLTQHLISSHLPNSTPAPCVLTRKTFHLHPSKLTIHAFIQPPLRPLILTHPHPGHVSQVDEVIDAMEYAVYVHDVSHILLDNLQVRVHVIEPLLMRLMLCSMC